MNSRQFSIAKPAGEAIKSNAHSIDRSVGRGEARPAAAPATTTHNRTSSSLPEELPTPPALLLPPPSARESFAFFRRVCCSIFHTPPQPPRAGRSPKCARRPELLAIRTYCRSSSSRRTTSTCEAATAPRLRDALALHPWSTRTEPTSAPTVSTRNFHRIDRRSTFASRAANT